MSLVIEQPEAREKLMCYALFIVLMILPEFPAPWRDVDKGHPSSHRRLI
jgi:hypothetical protein